MFFFIVWFLIPKPRSIPYCQTQNHTSPRDSKTGLQNMDVKPPEGIGISTPQLPPLNPPNNTKIHKSNPNNR